MNRRTLGQVKAEIARVCGATGMQASDPRVVDIINSATEELMNEADYTCLVDRYTFKTYGGTITLPFKYDRILQCKVGSLPIGMRSSWFEFVGEGGGLSSEWEDTCYSGVLDRDEAITFIDIPGTLSSNTAWDEGFSLGFGNALTYKIRLETQADERVDGNLPENCIIQGRDDTGVEVRTNTGAAYIQGESLQWINDNGLQYAQSTRNFTDLLGATKPRTNMPIYVYAVPSDGSPYIHIGTWEAEVTNPSYRRYRINGLNIDTQYTVMCRVRKRFYPVVDDTDALIISNVPALKAMCQAVYAQECDKLDVYLAKKEIAKGILNQESRAYRGNNKRPFITFNNARYGCHDV